MTGWGLSGGPPGLFHPFPRLWESGATLFLSVRAPLPLSGPGGGREQGVGSPAAGLLAGEVWAAELAFLYRRSLSLSLPVPTPHLCKSPGILLSPALVRAKALGREIDRGLSPSTAALLGPSMTHCALPGTGGGGCCVARQQVRAWCTLGLERPPPHRERYTLLSCGAPIHSQGRRVPNAFSKDSGAVPGTGGTVRKNSP